MIRNSSLEEILILLPALILAFTIHEISHGLASYALGDATAKQDGRLSLNPIRHIDIMGLLCILLVGFGWAKPVMVNPNNLKNPKVYMALIAAAGPISNFFMAFISLFIAYPLVTFANIPNYITEAVLTFSFINIVLGVFNLIPIPPLDGSKVIAAILPDSLYNRLPPMGGFGTIILLMAIFTGAIGRILPPITWAISTFFIIIVRNIYALFL